MPRHSARHFVTITLGSLLLAVALSACGVRGSLDPPPEARAEQEKAKAAAKADPSYKPAHKDFILDGLLR
jgi:predicted small lipoprotein YifL